MKKLLEAEKKKKKKKKKSNPSDRKNKKSEDSDSDKSSSHDESSSTSSDESDNALDRIKKKKEKKLKKDATSMVNSPLSLALKLARDRDPARSKMMEEAIIARSIRPTVTTFNMILKDDSKIAWDHILLLSAISAQFNDRIKTLKSSGHKDKAEKLQMSYFKMMDLMIQDAPHTNAPALCSVMSSLITEDTKLSTIPANYKKQRMSMIQVPTNKAELIGRILGYCFGFNFRMEGCSTRNCAFGHFCLLHNNKQNHPTMKCPNNSNRWTTKELDAFYRNKRKDKFDNDRNDHYNNDYRNNDYKYNRNRNRGGNRDRYNNNYKNNRRR